MLKFSGIVLACAALMGAMSNTAFAHGDKKENPAPVVKEQTAWGIAGDAAKVVRNIDVSMGDDMRFKPVKVEVQEGETIRFRIRNTGALLHEFVIGTPAENARHAELMMKFPGMEHDEPYMAHVDPGKTGEIVWTFNRAGDFEFACLIAGHFQAGMVGTITVAAN